MFCLPNDTTLASCWLTSFENTLAIRGIFFAQNHKFNFCTGHMRQLLALILSGTPLMRCLPNGTTLASCGLTSFKNVLAIWDTYFWPVSQIPHLRTIHMTPSRLNIKWCSAHGLPSQRHHPCLMWTFQLRESGSSRRVPQSGKGWESQEYQQSKEM